MTIKIGLPPVEATEFQKSLIRSGLDVRSSSEITLEINNAVSTKANVSHTHSVPHITGLQDALDNKADQTHTHTSTDITDFSEAVDDRVASLIQAGTNITLNYNDGANTLTISAAGGGGYEAPEDEVIFGGVSGNDSSSNFTYNKTTGDLKINELGPDNGTGIIFIQTGMNGSGLGASTLSMEDPGTGASSTALSAGNLANETGAFIFLSGAAPDYGGLFELRAGNGTTSGGGGAAYISSGTTGGAGAGSVHISAADSDGSNGLPGGNILLSTTQDVNQLDISNSEIAISPTGSAAVGSPTQLDSNAETGFLFVPTISDPPTVDPIEVFGYRKPIVYQPSSQSLWAFDGAGWHVIGGASHLGDTYKGSTLYTLPYDGTLRLFGEGGFSSINEIKLTDPDAGNPGEIYFTTTGYYKIIVQCRLDNLTPSGAFPDGSFVYGTKLTSSGSATIEGYGGEPSSQEMFTRHIRYQAAADLTGCPIPNVDRRESWVDTYVVNVFEIDTGNPPFVTLDGYVYKDGHTGTCDLSFNVTFIRIGEGVVGV